MDSKLIGISDLSDFSNSCCLSFLQVSDVIFNSDAIHTEVLALADVNSTHSDIYYGTLASRRLAKVGVASKTAVVFLLQNNMKSIRVAGYESGTCISTATFTDC